MKMLRAVALAVAVSCAGSPRPASLPPAAEAPADEPVGKLEAPRLSFPPTPAGKTLHGWFDVFNSSDEDRMKGFAEQYKYPALEHLAPFGKRTGGFEMFSMMSERLNVRFVLKDKTSSTMAVGWLRVKDGHPPEIELFELEVVPPGTNADDMTFDIDAAMRTRETDRAATPPRD